MSSEPPVQPPLQLTKTQSSFFSIKHAGPLNIPTTTQTICKELGNHDTTVIHGLAKLQGDCFIWQMGF